MNDVQRAALKNLCDRWKVPFNPDRFWHPFDLPEGYVAGWIGEPQASGSIYVGCAPDGAISS